jgi:hypothetical protein
MNRIIRRTISANWNGKQAVLDTSANSLQPSAARARGRPETTLFRIPNISGLLPVVPVFDAIQVGAGSAFSAYPSPFYAAHSIEKFAIFYRSKGKRFLC